MKILFLVLISISLIFVQSASDADEDRRIRAGACITLVKAGLHHNDDYFNYVAYSIGGTSTSEDLASKWRTKALLNCYNTISMIKSADLIARKNFKNVSPFAKDNEEILQIEKFNEKYSNDVSKLESDWNRLQTVLKNLTEELVELDQVIMKNSVDFVNKYRQEEVRRERLEQQEENAEQQQQGWYANKNLNLGLVTKMDPNVKTLLGLGLLAIIALAFYLGFRALRKEPLLKKVRKN